MIPTIRAATTVVLLFAVANAARAQGAVAKERWCSTVDSVQVSSRAVASLLVTDPIAALRQKCPASRDTSYVGESDAYPALLLPFRGGIVLAVQFADSLSASRRPDLWVLSGAGIILPGGLRLSSGWRAIRQAYGAARGMPGTTLDIADFEFCSMPGLILEVAVPPEADSLADPASPGTMPDATKVLRVLLGRHLTVTRPCS